MNNSRIDLNLLATLEVLLAEQNVTKAADQLNLSQPAVSAQLARLRDLFDDPLLLPTRRGMIPTAKAIELAPQLRDALDHVRNALHSHQDFDPGTAKLTISIGCSDYIQATVVMPLVLALRQIAPGVRVAVRNLMPELVEQQLGNKDVDLVIALPRPPAPHLRTSHLFDESYVLIGRRDHPRLKADMTIDEYVELEHVVVSPRGGDFETPVDSALATLGYRRNVVVSAASFLLLPEIVLDSDLVALVPRRLFLRQSEKFMRVNLPWLGEQFKINLIWHERCHRHAGHHWVRNFIGHLVGDQNICA
ncbi:MAG: LysR family transcriptional regulator [Salinicola sp.]|uniref:LysR family transcriptional regulator n=1 Tax=Salinicola sp. TaxID=1978524 RepID=UPI001D2A6267|nr:LysR family transcriptional regulator [Salinicola sp.]NRB57994.1 LysR family transcriptional regulator [Salinicola sp.]